MRSLLKLGSVAGHRSLRFLITWRLSTSLRRSSSALRLVADADASIGFRSALQYSSMSGF
jgi:hypothetical protein